MDEPIDELAQLRREDRLLRRHLFAPALLGIALGTLCLVLLRLRVGFWIGHLPFLQFSWKFLLSLLVGLGIGVSAARRLWRVLAAPHLIFVLIVYTMTGMFGYAVVDIGLDTSPSRELKAEVQSKRSFQRGGVGVTTYLATITLESTPPTTKVTEVDEATYAFLKPGQRVPAFVHPGLLGDPWFTLVLPETL